VQSLSLKTSTSVSLPIWTCDLGAEEGGRWDGLIADASISESESEDVDVEGSEAEQEEDESSEDEDKDEEMEVDVPKPKTKGGKSVPVPVGAKGKGKKRGGDIIDDDSSPKKKPKTDSAEDKTKNAAAASDSAAKPAKKGAAPSVSPDAITVDEIVSKHKRRRTQAGAGSAEATGTVITAPSASSPDSKAGTRAVAAAVASTPASNKKTGRAVAVDFFEDGASRKAITSEDTPGPSKLAPPPPNTPADGLATPAATASAKKRKRHAKAGDAPATPISGVIEKLSLTGPTHDEHEAADKSTHSSDKPTKKPRHKKSQKSAAGATEAVLPSKDDAPPANENLTASHQTPSASAVEVAPAEAVTEQKKRKRKHKKAGDDHSQVKPNPVSESASAVETLEAPLPTDAPTDVSRSDETVKKRSRKHKKAEAGTVQEMSEPAASLSVEELKQKRSETVVEKKKDKLSKRKRAVESAKEGLIGKKGLTTV